MNYLIIKTIMAKKQLKIPFKDGRPCKWVKDVHDEERDNYEFDECLEIYGFVRGRSSAVMILRPADDHGKDFNYVNSIYYQVFLTDSKEIIQHMIHEVIYGKWTFVKRGENFGIKLVKVLPGIHKCILRIAEKDILAMKVNKNGIYESGEKYDSTRFDRRIDACQG